MGSVLQFAAMGLELVIPLITTWFEKGDQDARLQAEWVRDRVVAMAAEGRDPTEAEWAELRNMREALHEQIEQA